MAVGHQVVAPVRGDHERVFLAGLLQGQAGAQGVLVGQPLLGGAVVAPAAQLFQGDVVAGGLGRAQQTGLALAGLLLGGRRGVVLGGGVAVTALRLLSEGGLAGGENKGKE